MSNPLKKIGKAFKSVGKAVKKVFKSDIFKAVAIGAAAFFALPVAATALGVGAGAAGGAAAGAGAGAWWSSTLGIGAAGAGTAAGTAATTAANAAGTAALGSTGAAAAGGAAGAVSPGVMAGLGMPGAATGQMAAMKAATPAWMQAAGAAAGAGGAAGAGSGMVPTSAALDTAAVGTGTTTAGKTGLLGKAATTWKGLDPMVKFGLINTAGQGLSGWASAKQQEEEAERRAQLELEMQERMWAREDELQNRKSVFGTRYDGSGGYDYNIGNLMYASDGKQSFGNFVGSNPGQKKKEEDIFAGYNPYWSA